MEKFSNGDRVEVAESCIMFGKSISIGEKGTIRDDRKQHSLGVEMDKWINGHEFQGFDYKGECKEGHGVWVRAAKLKKISKGMGKVDYKVGDRIEMINNGKDSWLLFPRGSRGDIVRVEPGNYEGNKPIRVVFDNGVGSGWPDKGTFKLLTEDKPSLDTSALSSIVTALRGFREKYVAAFDEAIAKHEQATTIEEIMEAKKGLLEAVVGNIPITSKVCYFCKASPRGSCFNCDYAKHHKECSDPDSDYGKIRTARGTLMQTVRNYYKGEQYTPPAPPKELEAGDLVNIKDDSYSYIVKNGELVRSFNKIDCKRVFKVVEMGREFPTSGAPPKDYHNNMMLQDVANGEVAFTHHDRVKLAEK